MVIMYYLIYLWYIINSTRGYITCSLMIQWLFRLYNFISLVLQAAKETGALQAAKSMLEKQVEELTWRLQLEKRMRVMI